MSVSFTKGPWKFEAGDPPSIVSYEGEGVVDLPMWTPGFHAERDANATLIAAAPDLYVALRELSFAAQTSGGTAGRDEQLVAAIDQAKAALAKATITLTTDVEKQL